MIENLKMKEENIIRKIARNAETRMVVYIYIYIVYCHLENKKFNSQDEGYNFNLELIKLNNKSKDRTILRVNVNRNIKNILKNLYFSSIGLSLCVLCVKISHKHQRAGP